MMKKLWGILFILLLNNSMNAVPLQTTVNTIKKHCSEENLVIAKTLFYVTQVVTGLLLANATTNMAISSGCIYDQRIALGGFALMASSFLYNGGKGIYELAHENKLQNKKTKITTTITPGMVSKKILKLLYHGAEIFMASGFLYDVLRKKSLANCLQGSLAALLLANGIKGVNEELHLSTFMQKALDKIKKKKDSKQ